MKIRRNYRVAISSLLLSAFCTTAFSGEYVNPTFNCDVADERAERIICSFEDLCILDQGLGQALIKAEEKPEATAKSQAQWVNSTRNNCTTADCLREVYRKRIAEINRPSDTKIPSGQNRETSSNDQPRNWETSPRNSENSSPLQPGTVVTGPLPETGSSNAASTKQGEQANSQDEKSLWSSVVRFFNELINYLLLAGAIFFAWKTVKLIFEALGSSPSEGRSYQKSPSNTRSERTSTKPSESARRDPSSPTKPKMYSYRASRKCCATCSFWHGRREANSNNSLVMAEPKKALCQVSIMTRDPITRAPRGASRSEKMPDFGLHCKYHKPWL